MKKGGAPLLVDLVTQHKIERTIRKLVQNSLIFKNEENSPPNRAGRAGCTLCRGELCSWALVQPLRLDPKELKIMMYLIGAHLVERQL